MKPELKAMANSTKLRLWNMHVTTQKVDTRKPPHTRLKNNRQLNACAVEFM
jgi:hypothetical protein